eukprot:9764216-Karenia_brevis.AAC.1
MSEISSQGHGGRSMSLDVKVLDTKMRFISAHLPHSGLEDSLYHGELAHMEKLVRDTNLANQFCFIGMDANASIGRRTEYDDSSCVAAWGYGNRDDRGHYFVMWLHMLGFCVVNIMFKKLPDKVWTHKHWRTGVLKQLDFVLMKRSGR